MTSPEPTVEVEPLTTAEGSLSEPLPTVEDALAEVEPSTVAEGSLSEPGAEELKGLTDITIPPFLMMVGFVFGKI